MIPFIGAYAWIVTKIIPGEDEIIEYKPKHLDPILIDQAPAFALAQARQETMRMGRFAVKGLKETKNYLLSQDAASLNKGYQIEEALNNLDQKITEYLVKISTNELSQQASDEHSILMHMVNDIERIGDHFDNILELTEYQINHKITITGEAMQHLDEMFTVAIQAATCAMEAFEKMDKELAHKVVDHERKLDKMERQLRKQHILRLNNGVCTPQAGLLFVDILSNLERIGDHSKNIAETLIGEQY